MNISLVILIHELTDETIQHIQPYLSHFDKIIYICQIHSVTVKLPERIEFHIVEFNNNFADLRNAAFPYIPSEWAFFLDSDEKISPELLNILPELINNKSIDGYWLRRKTYISPKKYLKHGLFYPDYQLRLFRKVKNYFFKNAIHEVINIPYERTKEIDYDIIHFPTRPKYTSFSDYENMKKYIEIYSRQLMQEKRTSIDYIFSGINKGLLMFLNGFFRGKGFLDGWDGFRAHILFARSITDAYLLAAYDIHKKTFQ